MVNATYTHALLSTLLEAETEAGLEGAACALVTLVDIAHGQGSGDSAFWTGVLRDMVGEGALAFLACKEMQMLPDVIRALLPTVCVDEAYKLPFEEIRILFRRLTLRAALDQTGDLDVFTAMRISRDAYLASCTSWFAAKGDNELATASFSDVPAPSTDHHLAQRRLHRSKLLLVYRLHVALRQANFDGGVAGLVTRIVDGSTPISDLLAMLRDVRECGGTLGELWDGDEEEVERDLSVVCCHGQDPCVAEPPKHDGKYTAARLAALDNAGWSAAGLRALAASTREAALAALQRQALEAVRFKRHKLDIVQDFGRRAEAFLEAHPWDACRHVMPLLTFAWTTDPREFTGRVQLWSALSEACYYPEDLQELRALDNTTVTHFDFDAWKASRRHFLPGFHIYCDKNLILHSRSFERFAEAMLADLRDHYAGKFGKMYARAFTPRMESWVKPYSRFMWEEACVFDAVRDACRRRARAARSDADDAGGKAAQDEVFQEILDMFSQIATLEPFRREAREAHIRVLIAEGFQDARRWAGGTPDERTQAV
eukprot:NODE_122_length_2034_cov_281.899949.p1 GENE.NODE_122_length_2034_cov_281.899949~~NODE_122_length_2034_cov_281.899949.p1  ORF type:complete len:631 (-),score=145.18 NODE_122_length_2034_cov_281.899949:141-1769(-)